MCITYLTSLVHLDVARSGAKTLRQVPGSAQEYALSLRSPSSVGMQWG